MLNVHASFWIGAMPGCQCLGWRHGLIDEVYKARDVGVNSVVLFPKSLMLLSLRLVNPDELMPRCIRLLKDKFPDLGVEAVSPVVTKPNQPVEAGNKIARPRRRLMELLQHFLRRRRKVRWWAVAGMLLACLSLLFSLSVLSFWSCESTPSFAGKCKKKRRIYMFLAAIGFFSGPPHRCPIPMMGGADLVRFPEWKRSITSVPQNLTYIVEDPSSSSSRSALFGGNQTWQQREESFALKASMKIHCGFAQPNGPELFSPEDQEFVSHCQFLVATCILDNYDGPHQPSNVSRLSKELFCFVIVVDHVSLEAFQHGALLSEDELGGQWMGIWRVLELQSLPYEEPRRNGKVPKLLLHRLFPEVHYSVWIDGKLELVTDPLLILERYLWRENQSFAIAQHKHHRSVYDEADACKRRKRYARPLIDKHMEVYRNEGLQPWSPAKLPLQSDVPEGALMVREHTPMTNLFCCLWFNEVNRFTPRDQLSFGYILHRLHYNTFPFFMFPNCEYNTLAALHKHVREHSSKLEWVKRMDELQKLARLNDSAVM